MTAMEARAQDLSNSRSKSNKEDAGPSVEVFAKELEDALLHHSKKCGERHRYGSHILNSQEVDHNNHAYTAIATFGRSLDLQCAHLLYLKALATWKSYPTSIHVISNFVTAALAFVDKSLAISTKAQTLFLLNRANSLDLKLKLLALLRAVQTSPVWTALASSKTSNLKPYNNQRFEVANRDCVDLATQYDLAYLILSAANAMDSNAASAEMLEADPSRTQLQAIENVRQSLSRKRNSSVFSVVFNMLLRIFPSLKRFEPLTNRYRRRNRPAIADKYSEASISF
jgi:hypothetical protein